MDFLNELADDIAFQGADLLAMLKQHSTVLAACNADVRIAGFAGAIDNTAHNGDFYRLLKPSSFRRRSTSLAISIMGYWVRPQVGQLMISGPATA